MQDNKFRMIHHVDQQTIDEMYHAYSPVFILSTGRAGSKFMAKLLALSPRITSFHEPRPTLQYFSNHAFHNQTEKSALSKMIDAARMESILDVFIKDKIYAESNQCLTFFAPVIAGLFRNSRFVHVWRHPGDFVRSAICKGWHKNDSIWESGRVQMPDQNQWAQLDHIEKLSWVWATTNAFLEDFKSRISPGRSLTLKLEDLLERREEIDRLMAFAGGEKLPEKEVEALRARRINELVIHPNEPPNMHKIPSFPAYSDWTGEMKKKLHGFCGPLAKSFGYNLF